MKRNLQIILTATTVSVLTFTALAQENTNSTSYRPAYARDRVPHTQRVDRLNGAVKASDLIGMTVKNYQNEKLGKVEELGVDVESGRVVQVILSTGGLLGVGDALTAVPPGALHYDVAQKVLHLEASKEKLRGAPRFESANWAEGSDSNHLSTVYSYYGEESSFKFIQKADSGLDGVRALKGQINKNGQRGKDDLSNNARRGTDDTTNSVSTGQGDEAWNKNRMLRDRQSMIPPSRLSQIQKAGKLMGTSIKNQQDETLGKVENLLVDLSSGRILAVIVSTGAFLGMGGELSAVPPTALRFNNERDTLQLDASKDALRAAPHFKSGEWPDFNQPAYADSVYRAYKVEPYFTTNSVRDVDNTARNVRDRNDRTLTPLDQGNSKADTDTTAQIRRGILAGKGMSVNAKNVKIITSNGHVTLRGPVKSEEEKRLIGEIANRIARSENVDNQLEVILKPTND